MEGIFLNSTLLTVFLAFIGYLITYLNNLRLSQRKERLERVNRQLGELYGPLFSLTQASDKAYLAFRNKYRSEYPSFFQGLHNLSFKCTNIVYVTVVTGTISYA